MSQKPQKGDKKGSSINWNIKFNKIEGSWDKIGSGKFNTAQRGDEESRRNRVYKNYIRDKGQHKESSKQFRWKQKYFSLHLQDKYIEDNDNFSSSYSEDDGEDEASTQIS